MIKKVLPSQKIKATILAITEKTGKFGSYLQWVFKDEDNHKWVGFTESILEEGNKLWSWLIALGIRLKVDDVMEFDTLYGKSCCIYIRRDGIVRYLLESDDSEKITHTHSSGSSIFE